MFILKWNFVRQLLLGICFACLVATCKYVNSVNAFVLLLSVFFRESAVVCKTVRATTVSFVRFKIFIAPNFSGCCCRCCCRRRRAADSAQTKFAFTIFIFMRKMNTFIQSGIFILTFILFGFGLWTTNRNLNAESSIKWTCVCSVLCMSDLSDSADDDDDDRSKVQ